MAQTPQTPIKDQNTREEYKEFEELARFLYPLDCERAVAHLMRSTPARTRRIFNIQAPVHAGALARMRALVDELERLDRELSADIEGALIVEAAGVPPGAEISTRIEPMGAVRNVYPFGQLKPGDWFWLDGTRAGFRNVAIMCQRQNTKAGRRVWTYQHLRGGVRVDRLP